MDRYRALQTDMASFFAYVSLTGVVTLRQVTLSC